MWIVIIALYMLTSVVDISIFIKVNKKGQFLLYISLMAISCAIGITNNYVSNMPSPARLLKGIVLSVIGN
jgi:hypothetical protein